MGGSRWFSGPAIRAYLAAADLAEHEPGGAR